MYGLWHPQEGVVNGHFAPTEPQKIKAIGQLRQGVSKVLEDLRYSPDLSFKFTVADMITGYGVAEAVKHYYSIWGGTLKGKRAIIQGWGNVGASAAYFLAKQGVKVTGIIDRAGGLIDTEGFGSEKIKQLFLTRDVNTLKDHDLLSFEDTNSRIWSAGAEIFIPAAASRLVTRQHLDTMIAHGLEVVSCGANVPFADPEIFFGPTTAAVDQNIALIPDFIANCGMARVFAYLMQPEVEITDEAIFMDTSATIERALRSVYMVNKESKNIAKSAFEIALKQLL